jgi:hypothetical protein
MELKIGKLSGDAIVFSIAIPLVTGLVWYKYNYHVALALLIFLGGMYNYLMFFFNITLSLKYKTFKIKLLIYTILSVVICALSLKLFGLIFTLRSLSVALVLYAVQLFFILRS